MRAKVDGPRWYMTTEARPVAEKILVRIPSKAERDARVAEVIAAIEQLAGKRKG